MNNIKSNAITLHELLSNANFQISNQHRRYIWHYGKCLKLKEDVLNLVIWNESKPNKINYYMGNLILQPTNQTNSIPTYLIIDGANRLITLSLLLSRILHQLLKMTTNENEKNQYQKLIKQLLYTKDQPKITLSNPDDTQYYFNLLKYETREHSLDQWSLTPHRERLAFNNYELQSTNSTKYLLIHLNIILEQLYFTVFLVNDSFEANLATFSGISRGEPYNELEILKHYLLLWVDCNIQNKEQHDYFTNKIISLCEKIITYHDIIGLDIEDAMKDISETNKSLKAFVQHVYATETSTDKYRDDDFDICWWRSHWAIESSIPITSTNTNEILHFLQTIETEHTKEKNQE